MNDKPAKKTTKKATKRKEPRPGFVVVCADYAKPGTWIAANALGPADARRLVRARQIAPEAR